jgi:hypothetical protein
MLVTLVGIASMLAASRASAQTPDPPRLLPSQTIGTGVAPLPGLDGMALEQRMLEVTEWAADYTAWKRWSETWLNRREPGWFGPQDRKKRPEPPPFLADDCRDLFDTEGTLADACRLLVDWQEEAASAQVRARTTTDRKQGEKVTKTLWWEHVHLDALWAMPQLNTRVYGLVGMHATVEVAGRFQVFVAPGAILLNLPTPRGTREWKPATDWGIAYRVFDFTFPGTGQRGSLHLNLARAWVFGGPANTIKTGIDLAGFSLTMKKPPRQNAK